MFIDRFDLPLLPNKMPWDLPDPRPRLTQLENHRFGTINLDSAEINQDLRVRVLEETTGPMLHYIYNLYKLECLIFGVLHTKVVPGINRCKPNVGQDGGPTIYKFEVNGVATFLKFLIHVFGYGVVLEHYYGLTEAPLTEEEIRDELDSLDPSSSFIEHHFGKRSNKYHGPKRPEILHVDLEKLTKKNPSKRLTDIDLHKALRDSFNACLEHNKEREKEFEDYNWRCQHVFSSVYTNAEELAYIKRLLCARAQQPNKPQEGTQAPGSSDVLGLEEVHPGEYAYWHTVPVNSYELRPDTLQTAIKNTVVKKLGGSRGTMPTHEDMTTFDILQEVIKVLEKLGGSASKVLGLTYPPLKR